MVTHVCKKSLQVFCAWRRYTMPPTKSINTRKDIVEKFYSKIFSYGKARLPLPIFITQSKRTVEIHLHLHLPYRLGLLCWMWYLDLVICHIWHSSSDYYAECDAWIQSLSTSAIHTWIIMTNVRLESNRFLHLPHCIRLLCKMWWAWVSGNLHKNMLAPSPWNFGHHQVCLTSPKVCCYRRYVHHAAKDY